MKKLIYIAGPYTKGDVALNVRAAVRLADYLVIKGYTPYVPHLTHFWHMLFPQPYEFWLKYDLVWLDKCDSLIRITGESSGADKEVEYAKERGMPVIEFGGFNSVDLNTLDEWLMK